MFEEGPEMQLLLGESVIFTDSCVPPASADSRGPLIAPAAASKPGLGARRDKLPYGRLGPKRNKQTSILMTRSE